MFLCLLTSMGIPGKKMSFSMDVPQKILLILMVMPIQNINNFLF